MRPPVRCTPAGFWRAFFLANLAVAAMFAARPAAPPELAQVGLPDAAEAARLIQEFRRAGIPGQYYLEFELRSLPWRGEEQSFRGRMWGSRNPQGAVTRVEVTDLTGGVHRLLIQNGEMPSVTRHAAGRLATLGVAELLAPLVPGVEVSAFDVQMPFLYWPGPTVEKVTRVLGRPAHAFLFRAPADVAAATAGPAAARAYLDTQYNQLLQTELLGPTGKVTKTFGLLSLKRVGDLYLPKQADYRNELTRDKTRLQVTGAALNLRLPAALFEPSALAEPASPPPADSVVALPP